MATVKQDFRFTGAAQTWVVPAHVTSAFFELWGAPGGQLVALVSGVNGAPGSTGALAYNNGYARGNVQTLNNIKTLVGFVSGHLPVTSGDNYGVYVGGAGGYGNSNAAAGASTTNYGPGGWNGGGNGGYSVPGTNGGNGLPGIQYPGDGGGGATDIRHGGAALGNRILVAGGGGGAGGLGTRAQAAISNNPTIPNPPYSNDSVPGSGDNLGPNAFPTSGPGYGGGGGGPTGQTGGGASRGPSESLATAGGVGGSQTAGGGAGASTGTFSNAGVAGTSGVGGRGGNVLLTDYTGSSHASVAGGGGGGGGYFGGGGGASGSFNTNLNVAGGGGGGGSNFVSGSFTGTSNFQHVMPAGVDGQQGVNGLARITYVQPPNPPTLTSPATGDYVDANKDLTMQWVFTSLASGETQGGYDIGYSVAGLNIWTTLPNPTGTAQQGTIPAHTLTAGVNYDLRVRVYDTHGDVSDYTTVTIHAVAVPNAPTITAPTTGSTLSTNPFSVTWTVDGGVTETIFRVTAEDAAGNIQVDSGDLYSTRVNACTNPSFETSLAGWITANGVTISQSTAHSVVPSHSMKLTWPTVGAQTAAVLFGFPTIPGKQYTLSAFFTVDTPGTDPDILLVALDSDGLSQLGTPSTVHVPTAGTFVRGSTTFTAQNNTSYLTVLNAGAATAGQVAYVDAVLIEYGTNLNTYFDGSNANGNPGTPSWQGTTNLSASQLAVANVLNYTVNWPLTSQPIVVKVRYADTVDQNLYSAPGVSAPTVNLNPPAQPVVTITLDNEAGTIALHITNPPGLFSAISNDIFRADLTNGTPEVKIGTAAPSTVFTDYTPVTQTVYAYRVRAYSSDGGFADAT